MNQFIKSSVVFILALVLIGVFCEILLRSVPNDLEKKRQSFDEKKEVIKVLILGNSHTYYGINPEYISKPSFNMAYISQSYDLDLEILKRKIEGLNSLKYVILSYSYFSLFEILKEDLNEDWRMKNYYLYYDFDSPFFSKQNFELISQTKPFYVLYNHYLKSESFISCSDHGWGMNYEERSSETLESSASKISKKHTTKDYSLLNQNIETLDSLISLSETYSFKLLFISMPCHPLYNRNLETRQKEINVNTMSKILDKCENCLYLDFSRDSTFTDSDFYDADHLNHKGSTKFTLQLDRHLRP